MRLLIIRHGDPDYSIDSLTEKGWKEAELLSDRIAKLDISKVYVSVLGRAKDTASLSLKKLNMEAVECDWLREFWPLIDRPDVKGRKAICWDFLPEDWMADERYFLQDKWYETEEMRAGNVKEAYDYVIKNFDEVLAQHGYVREGKMYRAERPNRDTIAFFCHFGLESVLLSHLMNVSPMIMWHNTCAAPSTVTTVITEERREGKVIFRVNGFGDISHLYAGDEEPAFAARFCETFDSDERHD